MSMFKFLQSPKPQGQQQPPNNQPPGGDDKTKKQDDGTGAPAGGTDDPLAGLRALWQTPENKQEQATPQQLFAVDPAKLAGAVKQTNFAASISEDTLKAALAGDAGALAQAINTASQNAFHAAMLAVPGMVEPAVRTAQQQVRAEAPALFRNLQLQNTRSENSVLNDPAISPVVEALKSQAAAHNPTATPQEIMALVEQQMAAFGSALAPQPAAGSNGNGSTPPQEDYSFLLN